MTRSVIDIDINDEQWKGFEEAFSKYHDRLQKMPGAWANVDKSMRSSFEAVAAALLAQNEQRHKAEDGEKKLEKSSAGVALHWRDIARSAKSTASYLKDSVVSLVKWVGVGSVISGLMGAGGLWGLDRLAAGVTATSRRGLGLGVSYGMMKAFDVNLSRIMDAASFLSAVNEPVHDVSKRGLLYMAGLNEAQVRGRDTGEVAMQLLPALKRLADRTPEAMLGTVWGARNIGSFLPFESFEALKHTPAKDLAEWLKALRADAAKMNLDPATRRAWSNFDAQLNRSGERIESAFIRGLDPLIRSGAFDRFSKAISDAIETFMKSPQLKVWMTELGEGLNHLAKYVSSKEFQDDIKTFVKDMGLVAKAIVNGLKWLGIIPDAGAGQPSAPDTAKAQGYTSYDPRIGGFVNPNEKPGGLFHSRGYFPLGSNQREPSRWFYAPNDAGVDPYDKLEREAAKKFGLPLSWVKAVMLKESRRNPKALSPAGAMGLMQLMPGTYAAERRRLGLGADPYDPRNNVMAGAAYLREMRDKYGEGAFAAYNAGPGRYERSLRTGAPLPDETQDYVAVVRRLVAGMESREADQRRKDEAARRSHPQPSHKPPARTAAAPVHRAQPNRQVVEILNSTGGSAIVTGSQIAR